MLFLLSINYKKSGVMKVKKQKNFKIAMFFLAPAVIVYLVFMIYPVLQSIILSFTEWKGYATVSPVFVGLNNYKEMFQDKIFYLALKNTCLYMGINILIQIPVGLLLALFLVNCRKGTRFYKAAFFMPVILSATAIALMWKFILAPNDGLLNTVLNTIGLGSFTHVWLGEQGTVMPAIAMVGAWQGVGYVMILMLAAIVNVPDSLIESSRIDGASGFERTIYIVVPLIWQAIKTNIVLLIIGAIKVCDIVYVMTGGGPFYSSEVLTTYMYTTSFKNGTFGLGSAIATFIFVFGALLTLATNRIMKKDNLEY